MTAVTNSGPLMALAKVGALRALSDAFETVLPSAVYREVVLTGLVPGRPDALAVQAYLDAGRLRLVPVQSAEMPPLIHSLPLDAGEKEAIYLAQQNKPDFLLLDDNRARTEAKALGLAVKGTLGVLVSAQRNGILSLAEVTAFIRQIQARPDIWIADALCASVLEMLNS